MSKAMVEIKFTDGSVRYALYHGSIDVIERQTHPTKNEVWNEHKFHKSEMNCIHEVEEVELLANYGSGIKWYGKCCSKCGLMIEGTDPYYNEDDDATMFP